MYGKGGQRAQMVCVWYRRGRADMSPPPPLHPPADTSTPPLWQWGQIGGCCREWNLPDRCGDSLSQQTKDSIEMVTLSPTGRLQNRMVTIDKRAHCPASLVQKFQGAAAAWQRTSNRPRRLAASVRAHGACKVMPCPLRSRPASQRLLSVISQLKRFMIVMCSCQNTHSCQGWL